MIRTPVALVFAGLALLAISSGIARTGPGMIFVSGAAAAYLAAAMVIATNARTVGRARLNIADGVTLTRLVIACLFAGYAAALVQGFSPDVAFGHAALGLGFATLVLDGVDGWIARRLTIASPFGARFDMEVDAFLILVLSSVAFANGKAGAWVLLSGAARYLYVTASVPCPALTRPLFASQRRKVIAVIQGGTLVALLAPEITPPFSSALAAAALALLVYSFVADIRWQLGTPLPQPLPSTGE